MPYENYGLASIYIYITKQLTIYVLPRKTEVKFIIGIKSVFKVNGYEMVTFSKYSTYYGYETLEEYEMVSNSKSR